MWLLSGLPFSLRSAYRAQSTHALRTHALLPRIRESGPRRHTRWGKHVPQIADKPKETEPSTMFNKVILIVRLEQNADAKNRSEQERVRFLNLATQESWKSDKGDYETRTEWHRVYAWRNLSKFAKTPRTG
jgi:agmatine/peptidylarginine deiminase